MAMCITSEIKAYTRLGRKAEASCVTHRLHDTRGSMTGKSKKANLQQLLHTEAAPDQ